MIYHTFLFDENIWIAAGVYIDGHGRLHSVRGEIRIVHEEALWIHESRMSLEDNPAVEFVSRSEILPMDRKREWTSWSSENPALGRLAGRFVLVDDSILSSCVSTDGSVQGVECLKMIEDDLYWHRGCLFQGDKKLSSWAVDLRRR
ncbi:MAG: hypothetical protein QM278_05645 [Pseudomonadota bacterium]|nr:hypothetical protein [Pseudomonadota bacterium]